MGSQGSCLGKIDLPETWRSVQLAVLNLPLTIRYSTNELPNYTRTCAESTMLPSVKGFGCRPPGEPSRAHRGRRPKVSNEGTRGLGGAWPHHKLYGDLAAEPAIAATAFEARGVQVPAKLPFCRCSGAGAQANSLAFTASQAAFGHEGPVPVCNRPQGTAMMLGLAPRVMSYRS